MIILGFALAAAGTTAYALYKHITVAQLKADYTKVSTAIKAEVTKLEASASTIEAAAKAEVVKIDTAVVADVKAAVAAIKAKL